MGDLVLDHACVLIALIIAQSPCLVASEIKQTHPNPSLREGLSEWAIGL